MRAQFCHNIAFLFASVCVMCIALWQLGGCAGITHMNGDPAEAGSGVFRMNETNRTNLNDPYYNCFHLMDEVSLDFQLSEDGLQATLTSSAYSGKEVNVTLTRQAGQRCFSGRWEIVDDERFYGIHVDAHSLLGKWFDTEACNQVDGTLNVHWLNFDDKCESVETTDGNPDAVFGRDFVLNGVNTSNTTCISPRSYVYALSADGLRLDVEDSTDGINFTLVYGNGASRFIVHVANFNVTETTTAAPETSTDAPETSTDALETSTEAPETSTKAPETSNTEQDNVFDACSLCEPSPVILAILPIFFQ